MSLLFLVAAALFASTASAQSDSGRALYAPEAWSRTYAAGDTGEVHARAVTPVRTVNHNVIGGGLLLALTTYAGSLTFSLLIPVGEFPWMFPLGSFYVGNDPYSASLGLAFGIGQALGIFFMVAGATIYRRRGHDAIDVALTGDGLQMRF